MTGISTFILPINLYNKPFSQSFLKIQQDKAKSGFIQLVKGDEMNLYQAGNRHCIDKQLAVDKF